MIQQAEQHHYYLDLWISFDRRINRPEEPHEDDGDDLEQIRESWRKAATAGIYTVGSILKIIPFLCTEYGYPPEYLGIDAPSVYQQIFTASSKFVEELSKMDGRVSQEYIGWKFIIEDFNVGDLEAFALSDYGEGQVGVDFSDATKARFQEIEAQLPEADHYGCAAGRAAPSIVGGIVDRFQVVSPRFYNFYF